MDMSNNDKKVIRKRVLYEERVRVGNRFATVSYSEKGEVANIYWKRNMLELVLYRGQWITNNCAHHYDIKYGGCEKADVLQGAIAWLTAKFGYTVRTDTFLYKSPDIKQEVYSWLYDFAIGGFEIVKLTKKSEEKSQ